VARVFVGTGKRNACYECSLQPIASRMEAPGVFSFSLAALVVAMVVLGGGKVRGQKLELEPRGAPGVFMYCTAFYSIETEMVRMSRF
jgi:hypothetical protein